MPPKPILHIAPLGGGGRRGGGLRGAVAAARRRYCGTPQSTGRRRDAPRRCRAVRRAEEPCCPRDGACEDILSVVGRLVAALLLMLLLLRLLRRRRLSVRRNLRRGPTTTTTTTTMHSCYIGRAGSSQQNSLTAIAAVPRIASMGAALVPGPPPPRRVRLRNRFRRAPRSRSLARRRGPCARGSPCRRRLWPREEARPASAPTPPGVAV